jgi:cellulose synthase/poly-beta-1,6-N-acetylglucosamine synthase-like glycosyltransferase
MQDITCAIPTCDDDPVVLERALEAAMPQLERPPMVVDMSRGDEVRGVAERVGADYVAYRESRGVSASRNEAVRRCETRYLLFLDADAVPVAGWATAMREGFEQDRVAIVGARVLPEWQGRRPALFGSATAGDWLSLLDLGDEPREVPRVMGTSYALDRERLGELPFDEALGRRPGKETAQEEVALALAASDAGWRCWYAPGALVRHQIPASRASWRWMLRRAFTAGRESTLPSVHGLEPMPRRFTARDHLFRALVAPAFLAGRVRGA